MVMTTLLGTRVSWLTVVCCVVFASALPTSLVEDVKDNEVRNIKVKRAHDDLHRTEESPRDGASYYNNPTAIKRGVNMNNDQLGGWDSDQVVFHNSDRPNAQPSLYSSDGDHFDDKSIADYDKGYRYGTGKDKFDEALENAVLKSELYGDPSAISQYRYYGGAAADDKKRRRRNAHQKMRLDNRIKRDVELSPEDILTILSLWESERQRTPNYRNWQNMEPNMDAEKEREDNYLDQEDESWFDGPVYPHITAHANPMPANFHYEKPQMFDKHPQWNALAESKKKRFMVARKRNDPTRELRYLNGPSVNDYYTLSQLLGNQREPNLPMYHRHVL